LIGERVRDDKPLHAFYNQFNDLREEREYYREQDTPYTEADELEFQEALQKCTPVLLTWRYHADEVRAFLKEDGASSNNHR
jgi:hypothetical protein